MSDLSRNSKPELSIIIVNWNTCELLRECLNSLGQPDIQNWEILVVDNGSTDGSPQMVTAEFPQVRLLTNETNLGFARANNQGLQAAWGCYLLLLNSDTIVSPESLNQLAQFMRARPEIGACSPQLLRPDGVPQPFAFGGDPTLKYLLRRGLNRLLFHRYLHDWAIVTPQEVDWVSGACLLVRRETVEQVGGLDENIFMYFEDNDWCLRIRQASWKIYYNPQVSITHLGGQSLARNPTARQAYYRSLEYFYTKHYGRTARLLLYLSLIPYKLLVRY